MIRSIADLWEELRAKELDLMSKFQIIKHAPTIGDMYEGLTRKLIAASNQDVFGGLDLRVVEGLRGSSTTMKGSHLSKSTVCLLKGKENRFPTPLTTSTTLNR